MKISQTVLELHSGHDFVTDRQTDRRPGQKQDVSQPYKSLFMIGTRTCKLHTHLHWTIACFQKKRLYEVFRDFLSTQMTDNEIKDSDQTGRVPRLI